MDVKELRHWLKGNLPQGWRVALGSFTGEELSPHWSLCAVPLHTRRIVMYHRQGKAFLVVEDGGWITPGLYHAPTPQAAITHWELTHG